MALKNMFLALIAIATVPNCKQRDTSQSTTSAVVAPGSEAGFENYYYVKSLENHDNMDHICMAQCAAGLKDVKDIEPSNTCGPSTGLSELSFAKLEAELGTTKAKRDLFKRLTALIFKKEVYDPKPVNPDIKKNYAVLLTEISEKLKAGVSCRDITEGDILGAVPESALISNATFPDLYIERAVGEEKATTLFKAFGPAKYLVVVLATPRGASCAFLEKEFSLKMDLFESECRLATILDSHTGWTDLTGSAYSSGVRLDEIAKKFGTKLPYVPFVMVVNQDGERLYESSQTPDKVTVPDFVKNLCAKK